jgi:hypothetical protein
MLATRKLRNRQIQLVSYPNGMIREDNIAVVDAPLRDLKDGEVLLAVRYISIDPALRIYIDPNSFIGSSDNLDFVLIKVGDVIRAWVVGEVIASNSAAFPVGSFARDIHGGAGVQEYCIVDHSGLTRADPAKAPLQAYLSVLGMTGLTAYGAMAEVGRPKPGETVVVSAAAGAVGGIAGQIAKLLGCRVIGIAGGQEKCAYVQHKLGFHACIDHQKGGLSTALDQHCPDGIDVYFDNVGGTVLDACLAKLAVHARVIGCGAISAYGGETVPLYNYLNLLARQARWQTFSYHEMAENAGRCSQATENLAAWISSGTIRHDEHIFVGLGNFVPALRAIYDGRTVGKTVLSVPHLS